MKLGHYIKVRARHKPPTKPLSELTIKARAAGLTTNQVRGRMRLHGMTIDEAIAHRPMTHAEAGRIGANKRWRDEA